jgi:single-strand DNA-binding protein
MTQPHVTITGNLTRAPELRFTTSGKAVASFSVAHNPRRKDAAGNWTDGDPSFFECSAWGNLAEALAGLEKGAPVVVVGRIEQQRWEADGATRSKVVVVADEVGVAARAVSETAGDRHKYAAGEEPF